jgi:hypothetical protein
MTNPHNRVQRFPFPVGPYGTNEGDLWTMTGSSVGERLEREKGLVGIWEVMLKDGVLGPCCYTVELDNPRPEMQELIAKARAGDEKYARAAKLREMWERRRGAPYN